MRVEQLSRRVRGHRVGIHKFEYIRVSRTTPNFESRDFTVLHTGKRDDSNVHYIIDVQDSQLSRKKTDGLEDGPRPVNESTTRS